MANFEYYLDLYSRNKQEQMASAYQIAYTELMAEYEEEVRVQEILLGMLGKQKTLTSSFASSINTDPKQVDAANKLLNQQVKADTNNAKAPELARKKVEEEYDISRFGTRIGEIKEIAYGNAARQDKRFMEGKIRSLLEDMTEKQQHEFVATRLGDIIGDYNTTKITGSPPLPEEIIDPARLKSQNGIPGNVTVQSVFEAKSAEINRLIREQQIALDPAAEGVLRNAMGDMRLAGTQVKQNADGTFNIGTATLNLADLKIAPPTREEVLARTAELYKPQASKKFQKSMEEIAVEREAQAAEKKKARQQVVDSLPPWAGQVMKVSGDIEKMSKMDDAEIEDNDDVGVSLGYMTAQSDQFEDMASRIAHINNQSSNDLEKQAALATLMSRSYRQYEQAQDNPLTDFINEE